MGDAAKSFLDELVEEVECELKKSTGKGEGIKSGDGRHDAEIDVPTGTPPSPENVVGAIPESESTERNREKSKKPRRPRGRSSASRTLRPVEGPAAHANARVQKSIRFLPHLIVQLDEHLQSIPPGDGPSLQDIMNDALAMRINANKGR